MGCLQTAGTPRKPQESPIQVERLLSLSSHGVTETQRARLTDELVNRVDLASGVLHRPHGRGQQTGKRSSAAEQRDHLLRARAIIELLLEDQPEESHQTEPGAADNTTSKTSEVAPTPEPDCLSSEQLKERIAHLNEELGKVQRECMKEPCAAAEARIVEVELELGALRLRLRSLAKQASDSETVSPNHGDTAGDAGDAGDAVSQKDTATVDRALARKFFDRYDLDGSGNLNTAEELSCVVMNLVWALEVDALPDQIDHLLADRSQQFDDGGIMEFEEFHSFYEHVHGKLLAGDRR